MRHFITALALSSLALVAACSSNTAVEEETEASTTEEALHSSTLAKKLAGDWVAKGAPVPTMTLDLSGTYTLDTGIRCIRAPCPSGETGRWRLYRGWFSSYVRLAPAGASSRWYRVETAGNDPVELTGVWGTQGAFVPAAPTDPCARVRCASGTHCESNNGSAQCVPNITCANVRCAAGTMCDMVNGAPECVSYPTCASTLCEVGKTCTDTPIVCVRAPCPPTAPSCDYVCPANGWINCMPGPGAPANPACSGAYHTWIQANCPGVDFAY